jgi:hypothetical protein
MSRRRTPYKPPRDRRELAVAVLCALTVIIVTSVLVWVFRPNKDLGGSEPTATTSAPSTTAPAGTTPTSTSTP